MRVTLTAVEFYLCICLVLAAFKLTGCQAVTWAVVLAPLLTPLILAAMAVGYCIWKG